jgi:hypothetical protein
MQLIGNFLIVFVKVILLDVDYDGGLSGEEVVVLLCLQVLLYQVEVRGH